MTLSQKITGWISKIRYEVSAVRKAVTPIVAAVLTLISIPALGVDPDVARTIAVVCAALGVAVYAVPNVKRDPQIGHP